MIAIMLNANLRCVRTTSSIKFSFLNLVGNAALACIDLYPVNLRYISFNLRIAAHNNLGMANYSDILF